MTLESTAPRDPALAPPRRRPGSVRRTSTVTMTWPGGLGTPLHLDGRCRDLVTPLSGAPTVAARADLHVVSGLERRIEGIASEPAVDGLERLVGCKAGGNLRAAIARELPDEARDGTPLYLLLDDLAGSTLIAGFIFARWARSDFKELTRKFPRRVMRDICSGFRAGASSLLEDGSIAPLPQNVAAVPPLVDPEDPDGWHPLDEHLPMAMRRARRIDAWQQDGVLLIDAMFRDSCWDPDGTEVAIHEYQLEGSADLKTGTLMTMTARPRVLPYVECPIAAPNASWMIGSPLRELRTSVLERLRGTDCCTHLNDALRSLAEVPVLAGSLPSA